MRMVPLSVLDLSPVTSGSSGTQALRNSLDLAGLADRLGYTRYWLAEHHNLASIASAAPEIMIGQIAARTRRLRVGSGGVMLPNHAPLMVAERFKVLEALFPGRIDLGIGRAPGTDPVTSLALRMRQQGSADDDFLERLQELLLLETRGYPEGHPFRSVQAMPSDVELPPIWLLGSSDYSSQLGAAIVCDDTQEEAERLASTLDLNALRRSKGEYLPLASPQEAEAYPYAAADREKIFRNRARLFVGTKHAVLDRLAPLIETTGADELMITSGIYDHSARKRCYELLAEAFGLPASA